MTDRIGPYEIERELGRGGMAEVLLATLRDGTGFAKRVALKRVLADHDGSDFARLFLDEARLCARLDHPNIVAVHAFGIIDGRATLTMEFVDGIDLRGLLRYAKQQGERLPEDVVASIALEVAQALAYAHSLPLEAGARGVVHRDVSPANILLSSAGVAKLADFGIARAALHDRHRTKTGFVKGKVGYMAPEQALGQSLDGRSDLFSLGVVLYEALVGARPYTAANDLETLQRAMRGEFTPLRECAPAVSAPLAELVEQLLKPTAGQRPRNAEAVVEALFERGARPMPRELRGWVELARSGAKLRAVALRAPADDAEQTVIDLSTQSVASTPTGGLIVGAPARPQGAQSAPATAAPQAASPAEGHPAHAVASTRPAPTESNESTPTRSPADLEEDRWLRVATGLFAFAAFGVLSLCVLILGRALLNTP